MDAVFRTNDFNPPMYLAGRKVAASDGPGSENGPQLYRSAHLYS